MKGKKLTYRLKAFLCPLLSLIAPLRILFNGFQTGDIRLTIKGDDVIDFPLNDTQGPYIREGV